jgi:hypothetical protein
MARSVAAELPHFAPARTTADQVGLRRLGDADRGTPTGRSALDRARAEGAAEAERRFETRRAEDRAAFDLTLAERDRRLNETVATVLTERLATAVAELEARIAADVARTLARFLSGAIRERALEELGDTIRALTVRGEATRLRVSGPADLADALRTRLQAAGFTNAAVTESDAADLSVAIDDTVIATRIGAWMDRVAAAVADTAHG